MYFVDRHKIEQTLQYLNSQLQLFEKNNDVNNDIELMALERISHMIIESILDVGNAMIDGFIMRDPGSYEDIVDILTDEKVITENMSIAFKEVIACRKPLVQDYLTIDHEKIIRIFNENLSHLKNFIPKVQDYLINELGPVSAFKN